MRLHSYILFSIVYDFLRIGLKKGSRILVRQSQSSPCCLHMVVKALAEIRTTFYEQNTARTFVRV